MDARAGREPLSYCQKFIKHFFDFLFTRIRELDHLKDCFAFLLEVRLLGVVKRALTILAATLKIGDSLYETPLRECCRFFGFSNY